MPDKQTERHRQHRRKHNLLGGDNNRRSRLNKSTLEKNGRYVHANRRLMDKISGIDYEEANVEWMEMSSNSDSDLHD